MLDYYARFTARYIYLAVLLVGLSQDGTQTCTNATSFCWTAMPEVFVGASTSQLITHVGHDKMQTCTRTTLIMPAGFLVCHCLWLSHHEPLTSKFCIASFTSLPRLTSAAFAPSTCPSGWALTAPGCLDPLSFFSFFFFSGGGG